MPFLLQSVLGRSAFATGLLMTAWPIAVGVAAPFAGPARRSRARRAARRHRPGDLRRRPGAARGAAPRPSNVDIVWRMAVCGVGFGLFQSPNNHTILTAAPKPRSGAAGGMLATARLLGQTTGAVAVGAAFHWPACCRPTLLFAASIAAIVAAGISLLRLNVAPPGRVAVYGTDHRLAALASYSPWRKS